MIIAAKYRTLTKSRVRGAACFVVRTCLVLLLALHVKLSALRNIAQAFGSDAMSIRSCFVSPNILRKLASLILASA